jgi:hypothetical protein
MNLNMDIWVCDISKPQGAFISLVLNVTVHVQGEAMWPVCEQLGNIFGLRLFWVDQFVTIEPEHVKVCPVSVLDTASHTDPVLR